MQNLKKLKFISLLSGRLNIEKVFLLLFLFTHFYCTKSNPDYIQIRLAVKSDTINACSFVMESTDDSVRVENRILINLTDIAYIETRKQNEDSTAMVIAVLTPEGTEKLSKITGVYKGRDLCAIVDNKVIFKTTIIVRLPDGRIRVSQYVSPDEAIRIANKINRML
jgi:preprotein translocase subunit SecD